MAETSTYVQSEGNISPALIKQHIPWQRVTLGAIILLSAFLEFFQLNQEGYANTYYAAGVKSMLTSWHNFFFVSFDAAGFVALDKPPLGFWIQAASAKLFGFSGFSLLLPEALAGVLSVALLYFLIARTFGSIAGLFAALALALTPITMVTDRNNTIDSLLIFTLLLAVWAVIYACETGRLRWLLLGAVLVGLGFNIKMLQAYLVVPALGLTYLLGAAGSWKKRIGHLLLALVVLLAVSLSWAIIVDLTPSALRPYVSDSGTNSEISLILGYNGLGRVSEAIISHIGVLHFLTSTIDLNVAPAFAPNIGNPSLWRLLTQSLGTQVSWLLPLALIGLVVAITRMRPHLPFDRYGQSVVMWGTWLLTAAIYFSTSRFFHLYYLVMLAPAIAAMAGIGVSVAWQEYRRAGWRSWFLPVALLVTAIAQVTLLNGASGIPSWLMPLIIGLSAITILISVVMYVRKDTFHKIVPGTIIVALMALLLAPIAWDVISLQNNSGSAWLPQAGPTQGFAGFRAGGGQGGGGFNRGGGGFGGFNPGNGGFGGAGGGVPGNAPPTGTFPGAGRGGFAGAGGAGALTVAGPQWDTLNPGLVSYLKVQQGKTHFLVATETSSLASVFMLATNQSAMAWGGYQGWDRIVTPTQLAKLVDNGTVRFFYISSATPNSTGTSGQGAAGQGNTGAQGANAGAFGGQAAAASNANASVNNDLVKWVHSSCTVVPSSTWQTSSSSTTTGSAGGATGGTQLYDCAHHR